MTSFAANPGLTAALARLAETVPSARLAREVASLGAGYRAGGGTQAPGRPDRGRAVAYAVYRMPATYAGVRAALAAVRTADPTWRPETMLDLGAGSGAAGWAAADVFASLRSAAHVERDAAMARVGREIARSAERPVVAEAAWLDLDLTVPADLPAADLAVAAYSLGELDRDAALGLLTRLAAAAQTVVVVEPGTPRGYATVLTARDRLVEAGLPVAAPCPHDARCPMAAPGSGDWCHFAVRLPRTAAHRRAKGGELGYEDEKFSYVAATRRGAAPVRARVVRHPQRRSGHVGLELCTRDDGLEKVTVSRRAGAEYRAARDLAWGDGWDGLQAQEPLSAPADRPPGERPGERSGEPWAEHCGR